MKLAVLSDIHGNEQALDAVLADAQAQGVDGHLILGDMVTDGPSPAAVLRKLRALKPWIIRGNREGYLINLHKGNVPPGYATHLQMMIVVWTYGRLDGAAIDWMQSLPQELSLRPNGKTSVRVVHGSPFGISDLLYQRDAEKVARAARAVQEDVLLYGHNHEPFCGTVEGRLLLNPGSVGVHFNAGPWAEYGLLTLENGAARGELRQVPYNFAAFAGQFEASGLLAAAPVWSSAVVESLRTGENCTLNFLKRADQYMIRHAVEREYGMIPNDVWQMLGTQWLDERAGWLEKALAVSNSSQTV